MTRLFYGVLIRCGVQGRARGGDVQRASGPQGTKPRPSGRRRWAVDTIVVPRGPCPLPGAPAWRAAFLPLCLDSTPLPRCWNITRIPSTVSMPRSLGLTTCSNTHVT